MSRLAIKGHATRGKEIIEILRMLGGRGEKYFKGNELRCGYYINENGYIAYKDYSLFNNTKVFTLEQFIEKFPYKVGDKVWLHYENLTIRVAETITCMRWCNKWDYVLYDVTTCCNLRGSAFTPYKEETMEEIKVGIPRGYEFAGVDDNKQQVVFEKIEHQYPKTYEECCKILDWNHRDYDRVGYNSELLCKLQVLLLCRDAYWKIAGDEMGWDKPWEPDYDSGVDKYGIICMNGVVQKSTPTTNWERHLNKVLDFPTEEMRDAFYENFKELIIECKELL